VVMLTMYIKTCWCSHPVHWRSIWDPKLCLWVGGYQKYLAITVSCL